MNRIAIAICLFVVGCGGGKSAQPEGQVRNENRWTLQQVSDAAHLTSRDSGLSWSTSSGCSVSVIMVSRDEVHTYASAGDPVATTPDGSAGVKFDGTKACAGELAKDLASLR